VRLFFTYLGGKYRIANLYPPPRHEVIVEPFAGSAGYSVRHGARNVVLVERDAVVAETWRYLIGAQPEEIRALPLIGQGWATTDDLGHLPAGARHLIGFWLSKATTAPRKSPSRWALTRPDCSYWGPAVRERIARQVDEIRQWRVIEGDYRSAPDVPACWFIDPPYQLRGHQYRHGPADMDYAALADWCRSRRGQVTVCEAPGASWLPFVPLAEIKGQRRQVGEAVWCYEPSAATSAPTPAPPMTTSTARRSPR
jgi:hypothetical protein